MAFLIVLLASLFASAWLLSTQTLHRIVAAAGSEGEFILFLLLSVPTFLVVLVASCGYFLGRRSAGTRRAALPLLINLASLLLLFFFPFGPIVDAIDFRVHETSRTEIVRLIETDQLPIYGEVIPLPRPYPDSISSLGGGRLLMAWREDGATHVFFSPAGT